MGAAARRTDTFNDARAEREHQTAPHEAPDSVRSSGIHPRSPTRQPWEKIADLALSVPGLVFAIGLVYFIVAYVIPGLLGD